MAERAPTAATAPDAAAPPASATPETAAATSSRGASLRAAYALGLAVQIFIWFLIILAIVVAVGAGGHLTQFRYVGF